MKSKFQKHCGSVYFLETLFLFGSYTFMIPYRIIYNDHTSTYDIKLFRYRKFVIWFLQMLLSLQLASVVFHGLVEDHSFKSIIIGTINLSLACWINITLFNLVKKKECILKILEVVEEVGIKLKKWGCKTPSRCPVIITVLLLCFGSLLISILEIMYLDLKFHMYNNSNIKTMVYDNLIFRAKYILHYNSKDLNKSSFEMTNSSTPTINMTSILENSTPTPTSASGYNIPELIFGSISLFIIKFYYLNVGHYGYATLFIFIFLLSQLFSALNSSIPKQFRDVGQIEKVIQLYRDLCNLTTQINDAIGVMLAWSILVHLPYNAYKTKDLLLNDPAKQISYFVHIVMYSAILMAGANVQSNATSIAEKIASDRLTFENEKLHSKVTLLQMYRVGVRGGNLFLLTYGFFGNIVGVILTYAILIAQFQSHCT